MQEAIFRYFMDILLGVIQSVIIYLRSVSIKNIQSIFPTFSSECLPTNSSVSDHNLFFIKARNIIRDFKDVILGALLFVIIL